MDPDKTLTADGWPTLGSVIGSLDSEVLRVVSAAPDRGARVSDVVILDRTDPRSVRAGTIVLGVGLEGSEGDAVALVDRAGRESAAAVVFRVDGELPPRVREIADSLDLPLLGVPLAMAWGQLYSLLRTAIISAGTPRDADAAGVAVGDLFALADAVAVAVGGPVTIEDPHWRVLAYANLDQPIDEARRQTILGRMPPAVWQRRLEEAGVAQALRRGQGVVHYEADGVAPRIAAAVRAGDEMLGSIWVAEGAAPLGAEAERALLRVAELGAIHLICHRASDDLRRRTRGAFVREVLEGRVPPATAAAEVPLRAHGPFTAIVFELADHDSPLHRGISERILSLVGLYCEDAHPDAMCALVDDRFWALVPTPGTRSRERTTQLASKIVDRACAVLHTELSSGVGFSVEDVSEVPRSRRAAERALEVLARREAAGGVVHIEDVRADAVLLELLELAAGHPGLLAGKLEDLFATDRDGEGGYAQTLRAYLDCRGNIAEAARRIGVHPNTLRYRVRRAAELSGIDFDDPQERFVVELQLRLRERGGPQRAGERPAGGSDTAPEDG